MPLQNRVTPFGAIVATPQRGTMLGNRGVLHDERKVIVRTSHHRRWICCVLEWKGIRRPLMRPRRWTELFFLDEATAFAAGHRPCFECRRASAVEFQRCWARAHGALERAGAMDRVLASDRRTTDARKRTYCADIRTLPAGTFVAWNDDAWLVRNGRMLRFTHRGYEGARALDVGTVDVLTPRATTEVLRAGYRPLVHASADPA